MEQYETIGKEKEKTAVEHKFKELTQACKNCSKKDVELLQKAFDFAKNAYGSNKNASGELQLLHSLSVALIVAFEIGLSASSVIAALLHDTIETEDQNISDIEKNFGEDIANIIRGFKKLSMFRSDKVSLQSENFRKLFLSQANDVRVIFIKMAHRLYDLRNYHRLPAEYQSWFLSDVNHLYIPIAHRLGLYQIKAELEDLAMRCSHPDEYNEIASKLRETKHRQEAYIHRFIHPIRKRLKQDGIEFEIKSRTKSIPSIKRKMDVQGVSFEQVYDVFAVRIILTGILTDEENRFVEKFKRRYEKEGVPKAGKKSKAEKFAQRQAVKKPLKSKTDDARILELEEKRAEYAKKFIREKKRYNDLLHKEKTACWQVYSLITDTYQPNPKRLRDWISTPKASGYESLHTTVLGPDDRWVEVQIRTKRMDEVAEKGDAAHWRYKEQAYGKSVSEWMVEIRNILDTMGAQKLDDKSLSKIGSEAESIFVFTPNGDLRELKAGATVLDFAFDIHSEVGKKCIGGKINDKVYPIRHRLANGDRVEIITAKNQKPNADWLNYVVTTKAKNRINRAIREDKYEEAESGKEVLARKFKNWKIDWNDKNIAKVVKAFNFHKPVDLFYNIAINKIDLLEIKQLFTGTEAVIEKEDKIEISQEAYDELIEDQSEKDGNYILIEAGVSGLNYSLAKCCNPIAGDRIFGFVTVNHGIKIHRYDCPNAKQMLERYPYRKIEARWKESKTMKFFVTNLKIIGTDRVGMLHDITSVISEDLKVNMKDFKFSTTGNRFVGVIKVQVRNVDHLGHLKRKLMEVKGISKIIRFD